MHFRIGVVSKRSELTERMVFVCKTRGSLDLAVLYILVCNIPAVYVYIYIVKRRCVVYLA